MVRRNHLAERFPLVGHGLAAIRTHTPRDADWLPHNWESSDYPRGNKRDDNTEAILQWLNYQVCRYEERLIPWLKNPDLAPEDPGEIDRGGPVLDAYRLVDYLQNKGKALPPPPCEPQREYRHYRDDLKAVVAELKKVRDWVAEVAELEKDEEDMGDDSTRRRKKRDAGAKKDKAQRGRPIDPNTIRRADFAKPLREKGKSWAEIAKLYNAKHPRDIDATEDIIRLAFERQYPKLK